MKTSEKSVIALEELKQIFADKPDVLKLLDPRSFNENVIEGGLAADIHRQGEEGFAKPVNMYVTGRTSAGKTSLGNRFLDPNKNPMPSSGKINCTDRVGVFKLSSNLHYYDLPGAGARENFENINRAALLMPQIEDRRTRMFKIDKFLFSDYTHFVAKGRSKDTEFPVNHWQSETQQKIYAPDVCLCVIAPHMGFTRDDEKYLFDLLETLISRKNKQNITIFGLNLHYKDGVRLPTDENIEDVRKIVTEIYRDVLSGEPTIIEVNSLTGEGVNQLTQGICEILPVEKLGKMKNILDSKLKDIAQSIRSQRYRKALIHIASRLATRKVDEAFGDKELLATVFSAVCAYGISVFKHDASVDFSYFATDLAETAKESRKENITVKEAEFGTRELKTTQQVVDIGEITEKRDVVMPETKVVEKERPTWLGRKLLGKKQFLETTNKTMAVTDTRIGIKDIREKEVSLGTITEVTGFVDKVVGSNYHKGGYPVIESLLSLGIGIENANSVNSKASVNSVLEIGKQIVVKKLVPHKSRIEQIIEKSISSRKAEEDITEVLLRAFN